MKAIMVVAVIGIGMVANPQNLQVSNKGDYVGKCRSALTQGAASAGGCSALSRAG